MTKNAGVLGAVAGTAIADSEGRASAPKWSADGRINYWSNCWSTGSHSACEIFSAAAPPP
jgi:hypothetical protein